MIERHTNKETTLLSMGYTAIVAASFIIGYHSNFSL